MVSPSTSSHLLNADVKMETPAGHRGCSWGHVLWVRWRALRLPSQMEAVPREGEARQEAGTVPRARVCLSWTPHQPCCLLAPTSRTQRPSRQGSASASKVWASPASTPAQESCAGRAGLPPLLPHPPSQPKPLPLGGCFASVVLGIRRSLRHPALGTAGPLAFLGLSLRNPDRPTACEGTLC